MKKILSCFLLVIVLATTFNVKTAKAYKVYRGSYSYELCDNVFRSYKGTRHGEQRHSFKRNITGTPAPEGAIILDETRENLGYKVIEDTKTYQTGAQITKVTITYEVHVN